AANGPVKRNRWRQPFRKRSPSETSSQQALLRQANGTDRIPEDQLNFNIESPTSQRAGSGCLGAVVSRKMIWIKNQQMETWACFACGWTFRSSGPPLGNSLDEMIRNFELRRDKEYASHVCTECPKTQN